MTQGSDGFDDMQPLTEQLGSLYAEHNRNFPMSDSEIDQFFGMLGDELLNLYEAEAAALALLKKVMT